MVLSEEACSKEKYCKDPECTFSHISPAAVLGEPLSLLYVKSLKISGETAGPSRLLCKYQNCNNPSCPFRHKDSNGDPIPPPALTAAKQKRQASQKPMSVEHSGDEVEMEVVMSSKGLLDGALDDAVPGQRACRYGDRCVKREFIKWPTSDKTQADQRSCLPIFAPFFATGFEGG
jgi:hypothetical protein